MFDFVEYAQCMWVHSGSGVFKLQGEKTISVAFLDSTNRHKVWSPRFSIINNQLFSLNRQGLYRYNNSTACFTPVGHPRRILALQELSDSLCLVGYRQGVMVCKSENDSLHALYDLPELRGVYVRNVFREKDMVWITTAKGVFEYFYSQNGFKFQNRYLKEKIVTDVCQLSDNSLWISTPKEVFYRSSLATTFQKLSFFSSTTSSVNLNINRMAAIHGKIWIATNNGVYVFDPKEFLFRFVSSKHLINSDMHALMGDTQGGVWLGGIKTGVNVYFPHNSVFQSPLWTQDIASERISSICFDSDNDLWISTFGTNRLYRKPYQKKFTDFPNRNNLFQEVLQSRIRSLSPHFQGGLLLGTADGSLFQFNKTKPSVDCILNKKYLSKRDRSALAFVSTDLKRNLVVGKYSTGANCVNVDMKSKVLTSYPIKDLTTDSKGKNWILQDKQIKVWNGSFLVDSIQFMDESFKNCMTVSDQFIYVGTEGNGLFQYASNDKHLRKVGKAVSSLYQNVMSIELDNQNRAWISSMGGLSVYNPQTQGLIRFNKNNGFGCGTFSIRSSAKSKDGILWFGGEKGLLSVTPSHYVEPELNYLNLRIVPDSDIEAIEKQRSFIENDKLHYEIFSSNFDKYLDVTYQVRCNAVDTLWHNTELNAELELTDIGKYSLEARATIDGQKYYYAQPVEFHVRQSDASIYIAVLMIVLFILIGLLIYYFYTQNKQTLIEPVSEEDQLSKFFQLRNPSSNADREFLVLLFTILEEHYNDQEFGVEQMQEQSNITHATFYRKVKSLSELTAGNIIKKFRLEKSKQSLLDLGSVSEAAYSNGFNDPKYYSRCFKTQYGITPRQFIEETKQKELGANQ